MQNIKDPYFLSFLSFLKKRETILSSKVNTDSAKLVYDLFIIPALEKGIYNKQNLAINKNEREKFIGEVFALSMYEKKYAIDDWIHNPPLSDGTTPDFSINKSTTYLEIYSPSQNHGNSDLQFYLKTGKNGSYFRKTLADEIKNKSATYKNINLTIIVHVFVNDFREDILKSLNNSSLQENHTVCLIHGDSISMVQNH